MNKSMDKEDPNNQLAHIKICTFITYHWTMPVSITTYAKRTSSVRDLGRCLSC